MERARPHQPEAGRQHDPAHEGPDELSRRLNGQRRPGDGGVDDKQIA
ncbi:MAG: hypothetical protein R3C04_04350 [Hyphomonas sp.]